MMVDILSLLKMIKQVGYIVLTTTIGTTTCGTVGFLIGWWNFKKFDNQQQAKMWSDLMIAYGAELGAAAGLAFGVGRVF